MHSEQPFLPVSPVHSARGGQDKQLPKICFLHLAPVSINASQSLELASALREEGWSILFACPADSWTESAARQKGFSLILLPRNCRAGLRAAWKLTRAIGSPGKDEVQILHACDPEASRLAALCHRLDDKTLLVHSRHIPQAETKRRSLRPYLEPQAFVICDSVAGGIAMRLSGVKDDFLRLIPWALIPEKAETSVQPVPGRFSIGLREHFSLAEGHAILLDALKLLDERGELPWELRLLGENINAPVARAAARTRGIENKLSLLPRCSALPGAVSACNVLVLAAQRGESALPLILEAWSYAVPLVAVTRLDHEELLRDGENCLLVPAGDSAALTQAFQRLAADASLRTRLCEGGRKSLQRGDRKKSIGAYRSLYQQIAVAGRRRISP